MSEQSKRPTAPRRLVVGTDFSESSRGALREAIRLAGRFGASLSVLHVCSTKRPSDTAFEAFLAMEEIPEELRLDCVVRVGSKVSRVLADYVEEVDADMLVVGPRARSFMEKHVVGSVAEQLVSRTRCATLATSGPPDSGYRKVVVAVDGSEQSAHAMVLGALLLEAGDSDHLVLTHALTDRAAGLLHATEDMEEIEYAMLDETREWVEKLAAEHLEGTVDATTEVRVGALEHVLVDVAKDHDADLVCMGSSGRRGLAGVLTGNAAERMLRTLGIPILIAHS